MIRPMFALRQQLAVYWPMWLTAVLIIGNLTSSRSFAHLGVKPLFIGEIALASFLFWQFRAYLLRLFQPLMIPRPPSAVSWTMLVFLCHGILQAVRGVMTCDAKLTAMMCFAFHLYPLFFFVGIDVGVRHPTFLRKMLRSFLWIHGIYGLIYILVLSPLGLSDAVDTGLRIFSQPYGGAIAILGALCFEQLGLRKVVPLLLNFFVLVGVQVRAEWLGFCTSFAFWTFLTGRIKQVAKTASAVALLALVGFITDFKISASAGRGGEISVRGIIGRSLTLARS